MADDLNKLDQDNAHQAQADKPVDLLLQRWEDLNTYYIEFVAKQIATIGELNASSINRMSIMASMNADIAKVIAKLADVLGYTQKHLTKVLLNSWKEFGGNTAFNRVLTEQPLTASAKARIEQLAKSLARQTMGKLYNLSNTTAITKGFSQAVDKAILGVTTGMQSWSETLRNVINDLGSDGLKVEYDSGYRRRLDSSARAAIVSACNQIAQQGSDIVAEELGCDCREITVHSHPAPDHAPVQGHVLKNAEWDRMESGLPFEDINGVRFEGFRRPIGEWNCMHFGMAYDSRYQEPKYSQEQLDDILKKNEKGFDWRGKHYTIYQGTQLMRKPETEIRYEMDTAVAASKVGDTVLQESCQKNIDELGKIYSDLSKTSGLPKKMSRTRVEGFRRWKTPKNDELKTLNCMKLLQDLKSRNPLASELHEGQQGKHIKGHPNYRASKSEVTISMGECRQIIYDKSGTGTLVWSKKGIWTNKERIVADRVIGTVTDKNGNKTETTKAMIHYGKDGAHLVPRKG